METKKITSPARSIIIIATIVVLTTVNTVFGLIWPPLLIEAGPTFPPPNPPTPVTPSGNDDDDDDDDDDASEPIGSYIELEVQQFQIELWTVVQWQDSDGGWHDVEGWRGTLDNSGRKKWWVSTAHFGKGPFRWVVYKKKNGPELVTSESFNLPREANKTLQIKVEVSFRP